MKNGQIVSLVNEMYNNGGNSEDLSFPVVDKAMFHADNCYRYSI